MDLSSLQSRVSSTSSIPPHRTQLHPRMHTTTFPSSKPSSSHSHSHSTSRRDKLLIAVAALLTLPFLFYLLSAAAGVHRSPKFGDSKPKLFGIVIHAAPSSSRIRIFEFLNEGMVVPFVDGSGSSSLKVRPGLNAYAGDPEGAGRSISGLVEFAKGRVPKSEWGNTKVQLMVNGELERVGVSARDAILVRCRRVLRDSGFLFKDDWASIMKGVVLSFLLLYWVWNYMYNWS